MTKDELWKHKTKIYRLRVDAFDETTEETVTLTGSFRVFGHQEKYFCSANMINIGTEPVQESLEYITVGNGRNFNCIMRDENTTLVNPLNGPCKLKCHSENN